MLATLWTVVLCILLDYEGLVQTERVPLANFMDGKPWWERWTSSGSSSWYLSSTELTLCDTSSSQPNEWVRSDVINTGPATRIELTATFSARDCSSLSDGLYCRHDFDVYAHQSETQYSGPVPDPNNSPSGTYSKIGTLNATKLSSLGNKTQNVQTLSLILENSKPYVYLSLHYKGGCLAVQSILVEYFRCADMALPSSLVQLGATVAPANNSIKVSGACAPNSKQVSGAGDLYGYCQSDGEWSSGLFSGECQCDAGHQNTTTGGGGAECQACQVGTYKAIAGDLGCTGCPNNSVAIETGSTNCTCVSGFYRKSGESINKTCTGPPSAPTSLDTNFLNDSVVTLSWSHPNNTGGRSDVFYLVECFTCNGNGTVCVKACGGTVTQHRTSARVSGLSAFTYYMFRVYARNGVSNQAERGGQEAEFAKLVIRTRDAVPGKPEIVSITERSPTEVFVQWKLEEPNGIITSYELTYHVAGEVDDAQSVKTNTTEAIVEVKAKKEYEFKVRARTRHGLGPYSETFPFKPSKASGVSTAVIGAVAGAALALLLVVIIIFVVVSVRRRKKYTKHANGSMHGFEMDGSTVLPTCGQRMYIDPSNYGDPMEALMSVAKEIIKDDLKLEIIIGGGEFADVYRGVLTNEDKTQEKVAVKILKPGSSHKNREDFCVEASIMGQFDHPNVIALKGVITRTRPMMIITEFLENGSLDNFLKSNDGHLTTLQLVEIGRGVAAGMAYLSEMNFIHRDLAARNILVSDNLAAKVSDFGLSRELDDSPENEQSEYQTQGGKIPVRWTAPEAIRYRKFSSASDVWSYGILLWEIMSFGERPYWTWDNFQVMDRVEGGYRLPAPMKCPKVIHNLMLDCWDKEKTSRPKFADIVRRLDEVIRSPDKMNDEFTGSRISRAEATNMSMVKSVEEWLENINMGRYADAFVGSGYVDIDHIRHLEDDDLLKMGINLIGHRNKIRKSIKHINQKLETGELAI
ncbi:ephrin type-A receptor 4 [Nematostella vectensis]|uniref:ephrin type-A receptor 4 n=1 Tax=Nematostella vectensis TaxID=45351 RepID=UPI0020774A8D|nr:ephrin type-A receptor 4 [Nematostella vectensis]